MKKKRVREYFETALGMCGVFLFFKKNKILSTMSFLLGSFCIFFGGGCISQRDPAVEYSNSYGQIYFSLGFGAISTGSR